MQSPNREATLPSARTEKILQALRDAREEAVKLARMHGVPLVYRKDGKIVHELQ